MATVRQGIEASSARGAPDTSGAVMSLIIPSGPGRLRPGDGGGGLLDRQQRHQPAQHNARDARDDGDQPGDAVGRHEARW